jgi:hypothetical protein
VVVVLVLVVLVVVLLVEVDEEDVEGFVDAVVGGEEVEVVVDGAGVPPELARYSA